MGFTAGTIVRALGVVFECAVQVEVLGKCVAYSIGMWSCFNSSPSAPKCNLVFRGPTKAPWCSVGMGERESCMCVWSCSYIWGPFWERPHMDGNTRVCRALNPKSRIVLNWDSMATTLNPKSPWTSQARVGQPIPPSSPWNSG